MYLIIANSARLLAQSAKQIGLCPLVIDCFSDVDAEKIALEIIKVDSLAVEHVKKAIAILSKQHSITHIIYGSGLENHLETLSFLEQNFIVIGNSFDVFASIQNKAYFFEKLKQQNIAYPETSFHLPDNENNWLLKPLSGEGGIGIKKYAGESNACYWQKYCEGIPRSVLFVANGFEYKIIGFHTQYVTKINDYPFVFAGVINQPEINDIVTQILHEILDKLVVEFSLKGINSLDFIDNENQCHVLEINARPSASLNLYDFGLLSAHMESQVGREALALLPSGSNLYRAYKIFFAETDIAISNQIAWPSWVLDIPSKGSIINTGNPICSIIAGGKNEQQAEHLLLFRQQQLTKLLT